MNIWERRFLRDSVKGRRSMPYLSIEDLPAPVKNNLPRHAQKIFKDAFNSAYKEHHGDDEVTSFKIAWAAVKKTYEKRNGKWVKKNKAA